jgi:hypothetical protein
MINIKKRLHLFCLWLTRPYPFQLWIAPRKKNFFSDAEPKRKSPPGFSFKGKTESGEQTEYAMYLYPDGIRTYWVIYFLATVVTHAALNFKYYLCNENFKYYLCNDLSCKYVTCPPLFGLILFIVSYYMIYVFMRKPVLDDVLAHWSDTAAQIEYFKNITSRVTFASKSDLDKYSSNDGSTEKNKLLQDKAFLYKIKIFLATLLESCFLCKCVKIKSTPYFHRPVFFNPKGSFEEGMLKTAIADFFVPKRNDKISSILLLVIYLFPHVWISYLYLFINLACIYLTGDPYTHQKETIPLIILILLWLLASVFVLTIQYKFIVNNLTQYDKKMFNFAPARIIQPARRKIGKNREIFKTLKPKITIPAASWLVFTAYLTVLNLVLQYAEQKEKEPVNVELSIGKKEQLMNIESHSKNVIYHCSDSMCCDDKCCF